MSQHEYVDLLKRFLGTTEALLDVLALAGALTAMLVTKGVCTQEEIEEAKRIIYEGESMKSVMQSLAERKAELDELEKTDPATILADIFERKLKGE